jgi:hypothetical protein
MNDPFAPLDVRGIEAAERNARRAHPILFRVAEFIVFVRDPVAWIRARIVLRRAGYRGKAEPEPPGLVAPGYISSFAD